MATEGEHGAHLRTFMIADVRGYTTYTRSHGDEAAGDLAARFASVVRAATEAADGRLVETRGDEALAAFSSARHAVAAQKAGFDTSRAFHFHPFTPKLPNSLGEFHGFGG